MTTEHHTPYQNSTTAFKAADMNGPLSELDTAIGTFTANAGKLARVNEAQSALEYIEHTHEAYSDLGGSPTSSQVIMRLPFVRDAEYPTNMSGSYFIAGTAATGSTVFSIQKNGVQFGTATFAASATSATFSAGSPTILNRGDILTIVAPGSPDATLADLGWNFLSYVTGYSATTTTTTSSTTTTTTA